MVSCVPFVVSFIVSTGGRLAGSLCYFANVSKIVLMHLLLGALPAFWSLYGFACGGLLANMPLFGVLRGFLEGFMGFVWVCVGWVLCVACVAFVRVWS